MITRQEADKQAREFILSLGFVQRNKQFYNHPKTKHEARICYFPCHFGLILRDRNSKELYKNARPIDKDAKNIIRNILNK